MRSYRYIILAGLVLVGLLSLGILIFHWLQPAPLVPVQVENVIMVQPGVSIQEAIDKAWEGAVIQLAAGTWEENIRIEIPLTLRGAGAGQTIIDGIKEGYPVVRVVGPQEQEPFTVTIEGLTITGAAGESVDPDEGLRAHGMLIQGGIQVKIADSTISGNERHGIVLRDTSRVEITDSTVSGNEWHGILLRDTSRVEITDSTVSGNERGAGILLRDESQATITHSTILGNSHGIQLWNSPQAVITGSIISRNELGITLGLEAQAVITDSIVSENRLRGIGLGGNAKAVITDSTISGNWREGIELGGNAKARITDSTISGNWREGIGLGGNAKAKITGSTILGNRWEGIELWGEAKAQITTSTISGNRRGIWLIDRARAEITDSTISENWRGIEVSAVGVAIPYIPGGGSAHAVITGSVIAENDSSGIVLSATSRAEIIDSIISANRDGVTLRNEAKATISGSTISGNDVAGIKLWNRARTVITDSIVSANFVGIKLWHEAHVTVSTSTISEHKSDGIELLESAQAVITGNLIQDNEGVGILSFSADMVTGGDNSMLGNGVDLAGNLPSGLRSPLMEPGEQEIRLPDPAFPTFQHAVDALVPGGRLILGGGSYTGGVTIDKDLTIKAQEGTKPRIEGGAAVISLVGAARVRMAGLHLTGGEMGLAGGATAQVLITDSTISENAGHGIVLWGETTAEITGSIISRNRDGIELRDSVGISITGSAISENRWDGLVLRGAAQAYVADSSISHNEASGIELRDSVRISITGSTISGNREHGIELWDSARALLEGNTISDNRFLGISALQMMRGYVAGSANVIPDSGDLDENHWGAVSPAALRFLMTQEGREPCYQREVVSTNLTLTKILSMIEMVPYNYSGR